MSNQAVQSGVAQFGQKNQYGLLTKEDSGFLLRMGLLGALSNPSEGYAYRTLLRKMLPVIGQADALMMAKLLEGHSGKEWGALRQELLTRGGDL